MRNFADKLEWLPGTADARYDTAVEDDTVAKDDTLDHILLQKTDERAESSKNVADSMTGVETTKVASETVTLEAGFNLLLDAIKDPEPRENVFDEGESGSQEITEHKHNEQDNNSTTASSCQLRLHAIEVVLAPPSDPDSYRRIPPSRTVIRVLRETDGIDDDDDDIFYEVEFRDGRIEHASYDDVIYYTGGQEALDAYTTVAKNLTKRYLPEDEYEESDSDDDNSVEHRKHHKSGTRRSKRQATLQATREISRQTSRQVSIFDDAEELEFKDSTSRLDWDDELMDEVRQGTSGGPASVSSRAGRQTRSQNSTNLNRSALAGSDDELAQDYNHSDNNDDVDYIPLVSSDLAHISRGPKRKKLRTKAGMATRHNNRGSSIEFETARRSGRSTRNVKSMKDPGIDEYYSVEEKRTAVPKHASIKEVFQKLAPGSPFLKVHSETCESCLRKFGGDNGPLIHCQGCSLSYHRGCIGPRPIREHRVTKVGHEDFVFQCKFCIQVYKKKDARAPEHARCQACNIPGTSCAEFSAKQTPKQEEKARMDNEGEDPITQVDPLLINNADNVLFRCASCKRGYHFDHLPALTTETIENQDLTMNRIEEYSIAGWNCKDCLDIRYKIHSLVAWRPLDQSVYTSGQTNQEYAEDSIEYLVKWAGRSHFHDVWMPGAWVFGAAPGVLRQAFHKRDSSTYPKMDKAAAIEEEWLLADVVLNVKYGNRVHTESKAEDSKRIDDITSIFVKFQGLSYEEVVWDEPPQRNSGAPWDAFVAAYDEYLNGKYFVTVPDYKMRERIALYRSLDFGKDCELKSQPAQLKEGKLMEYQIEGVNFLLYNFHQQQNVILADEMGLGKTVQIVAFISALTHSKPGCWPFLVVVPNATCPNWRRELKRWAPDLRVVTYHGGKAAQDLAFRHELYPDGVKGGMKAHVVIMSYEAAANVKNVFYGVKWVGLIVDEGQRLKNEETILYKSLQEMKIPCRILLTGTPLQNNKRELFNLLQFIDKKRNAAELDAQYAELTKDNLPQLHSLIRPYFLRRTKAQVLKFLPPMAQIILPVTMTVVQEKLSKSIMARNPDLIRAIISKSKLKAGERKSMSNILSDLRLCLCHPFCFNTEVEDRTVDMEQMHRNLIEASPKLLLLELMLPKLQEKGHRVLIFSQFLHSLTILEDFLTGLNMAHARIDGALSALEKQKRIDAFNAPDSPLFAMLLSTRAGGVGINLATADTVIIYDPDFNPHQDIQALSRAHRIGQKRKVLCFQLMTKDTVEEKIMQMGRKKMALDHALIESMDAKEEAGEDLESILKHGAAALFSDESKNRIIYDNASVDKLLDRSQVENTDTAGDDSAETQFSFARIWANDKGDLATDTNGSTQDIPPEASTSIWENILKEREAQHERELAANQKVYGRGARRQPGIDYKTNRPRGSDGGGSDVDIDDELYVDGNDTGDNSDDSEAVIEEVLVGPAKAKQPKEPQPTLPSKSTTPKPMGRPRKSEPKPPKTSPQPPTTRPQASEHPRSMTHVPPPRQFPTVPTQLTANNSSPYPIPVPSQPSSLTAASNPTIPRRTKAPNNLRVSAVQPPAVQPLMIQSPTIQPPAVQLPNGLIAPTGWIGGGSPCFFCGNQHSTREPCINLNSEVSLRLGLDRLSRGSDPSIVSARAFFAQRLQAKVAQRRGMPQ
ncbi:PHD/FYVE-zinc-finger like domain-containing protein [Nemania sp. NC0429]|nr:PHD/FYVE-zinc-finger like domain-containing protein [Nemania sp. NC0429]